MSDNSLSLLVVILVKQSDRIYNIGCGCLY